MTLFLAGAVFPTSDPAVEGIDAAWDEFVQLASGTGRKRGGRRRRRLPRAPHAVGQPTESEGAPTESAPVAPAEQDDQQVSEPVVDREPTPPAGERILVVGTEETTMNQAATAIGSRNPQIEVITAAVATGELTLPDFPELLNGVVFTAVDAAPLLTALASHRRMLSRLVRQDTPLLAFGSSAAVVGVSIPGEEGDPVEALRLVGVGVSVEPVLNHTIDAMARSKLRTTVVIDPDAVLRVDAITGRTRVLGAGRITWVGHADDHFIIHHEPTGAPAGETD